MSDPERIIRLRLCESNLRLLEQGVTVSAVQLGEGVDGIYEVALTDPPAGWNGSVTPRVALEDPDGH